MMIPTVHLNGTSYEALFEEADNARAAVGKALAALNAMTVHGRDYYVQGPNAIYQAQDEHAARIRALRSVLEELIEYTAGIINSAEPHRFNAIQEARS